MLTTDAIVFTSLNVVGKVELSLVWKKGSCNEMQDTKIL